MTGPAPAAPVPVPPPLAPEAAPATAAPETEGGADEGGSSDNESPVDDRSPVYDGGPVHDGGPPDDAFDDGAQPDPFADATPERPPSASERASVAPGRPPQARSSAEALAEAAAGERLELLRSVFPGRVLRLVPPAAQGGAGGRAPVLDDANAEPPDATPDPDGADTYGADTDPNEPGGSP